MKKQNLRSEFLKTMTQLWVAAFGLVSALAWNEAVKALIDKFIEPGSGVKSKVYYAILVTIVTVIVTYVLGKSTQEAKEKEEDKK